MDGNDLYNLFCFATQEIIKNKDILNKINVFPVADGDTGSNLVATLENTLQQVVVDDSYSTMINNLNDKLVLNAQGNSGMILSEFFSGLNDDYKHNIIDVEIFVNFLKSSIDNLLDNFIDVKHGTILTVFKEWSNKLCVNKCDDFKSFFEMSTELIHYAVENTINQMPILKAKKIPDAGALGFYYMISGFSKYYNNEPLTVEIDNFGQLNLDVIDDTLGDERYCCQFIVQNFKLDQQTLLKQISTLGNCFVMLSHNNFTNIHFHTNKPWLIAEIIETYGSIRHSKIQDMFHNIKPQKRIGFITDSGADIEREIKYANDVYTIPLGININGSLYYDNLTIVTNQLLNKLDDQENIFNTVSPSDGVIKKTIDEALLHYQFLIITLVSSKMSGTYHKICKLVKQTAAYANRILVVDSCMNSASQGLLLKKIIESDFENFEFNQIEEYINQLKMKISTYVVINDFNNLSKTGRVSNSLAKLATIMKMNAILTLDKNGSGKAFGLSFNSIKCHNKILKRLIKDNKRYKLCDIIVYYSNITDQMRRFVGDVTSIVGHNQITLIEVAPSTALHVGKDCYAICYQKEGNL